MKEYNKYSINGVVTRNQKKMISETNNDKTITPNDSTNIKEKHISNNVDKEKVTLGTIVSDLEFELDTDLSTEEEEQTSYYSSEDEEELKQFEKEMLAEMEQVDKEEELELKQKVSVSNTIYKNKDGIEIEIIETTSEQEDESGWETEEEEDIETGINTNTKSNLGNDKKSIIDALRKMGKEYKLQPTYEVIIDDSMKQERRFKEKQQKVKNKFLQGISEERRKNIEECEKQLKERNKLDIPPYYQILELDIPIRSKEIILKYMSSLENLDETSTDYHKFESFVETCKEVPFGKYITLPKPDNFSEFLMNSAKILNDCVYGHDIPKLEILQYLSQLVSNPTCKGQPLGIYGPPGIGKTTLIQEGLAKVLKRPFYFISLGGCSDSSFLDGHSFTYEGSRTGKIVDILRSAHCMNPIIYFDELDKISDTSKGEEISNLLVHLTDESQNSHFHDKYLHDIELDLSKAFFVFSFNNLEKVNPILRDRINTLYLKDFKKEEKTKIAKNYLIPKIKREFNMDTEEQDYNINDDMISYILDKHIEKNETGVRTLKRLIRSIYAKINMLLLSDGSETILELLHMKRSLYNILINNKDINDREVIDFLLKSTKNKGMDSYVQQVMYT